MIDLVEVFATDSDTQARLVLDVILRPCGIDGVIHDRRGSALPAPASAPGRLHVAVPLARAAEARRIIRDAVTDGALDAAPPGA